MTNFTLTSKRFESIPKMLRGFNIGICVHEIAPPSNYGMLTAETVIVS